MKNLLIFLLSIISISAFGQAGSLSQSVYRSRVNDSTAAIAANVTPISQGYAPMFWNNQATVPHWDWWDGSAYQHSFSAGGNFWKNAGTTTLTAPVTIDNDGNNVLIGDLTGPYSYLDIDGTGPNSTPNSYNIGVGTSPNKADLFFAHEPGLSAATLTVNESAGGNTTIVDVVAGIGAGFTVQSSENISITSSGSAPTVIGSAGASVTMTATSVVATATDDINLTAGTTSTNRDINLTASNGGVHIASSAVAITDASSMNITSNKHTLTTSSATRTFTQSYTGDYSVIILTLSTTSCVFTFPAGALCKYNGVDSGDNTLTVTGVSGDKHIISILKNGTDYYVAGSKFGQ